PADASVCGFDTLPAAKAAGLTTVHQPIREKGQPVGRLLIDPHSSTRHLLMPIILTARYTHSRGPQKIRVVVSWPHLCGSTPLHLPPLSHARSALHRIARPRSSAARRS